MAKRDLKKYLSGLTKEQLEEQFVEMYEKFKDVRTYYDFVFNPREEKLAGEARSKILNEYFPVKGKRARLRRSVAQKFIKHFLLLGVEPHVVADLMLFSIETAQRYSSAKTIRFESFYKSMMTSLIQLVKYAESQGIVPAVKDRVEAIASEAKRQRWPNSAEFARIVDEIEAFLE